MAKLQSEKRRQHGSTNLRRAAVNAKLDNKNAQQ